MQVVISRFYPTLYYKIKQYNKTLAKRTLKE